jgi:hypothetical protein
VTIAQQYTASAFSESKTDNAGRRIPLPQEVLFSADRTNLGAETPSEGGAAAPNKAEVIELIGGPCRDRTYDQEIKSLLLYQLS